jgi:hypothetical protein
MSRKDETERAPSRKISAQDLTGWADILRDRSALGLYYTTNIYDREHYQKIQEVAMAMVAAATSLSASEIESLRTTFFAHPSPIPSCDAAVIDHTGRILIWHHPFGNVENCLKMWKTQDDFFSRFGRFETCKPASRSTGGFAKWANLQETCKAHVLITQGYLSGYAPTSPGCPGDSSSGESQRPSRLVARCSSTSNSHQAYRH